MAAQNFPRSLEAVLKHEGGYTNEATDPGGPTNWGITIADARMYWKQNATAADVRAMPLEVAKAIYKSKYWDRLDCDNLPSGVDYCTFDYGVNSGVHRADGVLAKLSGSSESVINGMCDERLAFLKRIRHRQTGALMWDTYGRGWSRRVADVRALSLRMAAAETIPPPPDIPIPEPKQRPLSFWERFNRWLNSLGE